MRGSSANMGRLPTRLAARLAEGLRTSADALTRHFTPKLAVPRPYTYWLHPVHTRTRPSGGLRTSACAVDTEDGDNVSGRRLSDVLHLVRVHAHEPRHTHLAPVAHIGHRVSLLDRTAVHTNVRQLPVPACERVWAGVERCAKRMRQDDTRNFCRDVEKRFDDNAGHLRRDPKGAQTECADREGRLWPPPGPTPKPCKLQGGPPDAFSGGKQSLSAWVAAVERHLRSDQEQPYRCVLHAMGISEERGNTDGRIR
eukprot:364382-Chlamydomonas_euryale.AAC.5